MPTIEERLQALEREHAKLKKTVKLQTTAIDALVNKTTLEKLEEKYNNIFDALITHDRLTNERLGDLQTQLVELDGKIVGQQTEMHQRFNTHDSRFTELDGKIVGLQTEMHQRFNEHDSRFAALDSKVTALQATQAEHAAHLTRLETKSDEQTRLLTQILERLPKNL
jgi:chromosome segregation ATPase